MDLCFCPCRGGKRIRKGEDERKCKKAGQGRKKVRVLSLLPLPPSQAQSRPTIKKRGYTRLPLRQTETGRACTNNQKHIAIGQSALHTMHPFHFCGQDLFKSNSVMYVYAVFISFFHFFEDFRMKGEGGGVAAEKA